MACRASTCCLSPGLSEPCACLADKFGAAAGDIARRLQEVREPRRNDKPARPTKPERETTFYRLDQWLQRRAISGVKAAKEHCLGEDNSGRAVIADALFNISEKVTAAEGLGGVVAEGPAPSREQVVALVAQARLTVMRTVRADDEEASSFRVAEMPTWALPGDAASDPQTAARELISQVTTVMADEGRGRDKRSGDMARRASALTSLARPEAKRNKRKAGQNNGRAVYPVRTSFGVISGPTGAGKSTCSLDVVLRAAQQDPDLRVEVYVRDGHAAKEMLEKVNEILDDKGLRAPHMIVRIRDGRLVSFTDKKTGAKVYPNCERGAELEGMERAAPAEIARTVCGTVKRPICRYRNSCRYYRNGEEVADANILIMSAARLAVPRTAGERRPRLKKEKNPVEGQPRKRAVDGTARFLRLIIMIDEGLEELEVETVNLDPALLRQADVPLIDTILDALEGRRDVFETLFRANPALTPEQAVMQDHARAEALIAEATALDDIYDPLVHLDEEDQRRHLEDLDATGKAQGLILLTRLREAIRHAIGTASGLGVTERLRWHAPRLVDTGNATTGGKGLKLVVRRTFDRLNDAELVLALDATPADDSVEAMTSGLSTPEIRTVRVPYNPPVQTFHVRFYDKASLEDLKADHRKASEDDEAKPAHWRWLGLTAALAMVSGKRPGFVSSRAFCRMHGLRTPPDEKIEALYFYAQRGSNMLADRDMVVMIGDPRRPSFAAADKLVARDPTNPYFEIGDDRLPEAFLMPQPSVPGSGAPDATLVYLPSNDAIRRVVVQDIMAEAAHAAGRLRAVHVPGKRLLFTVGHVPPAGWSPVDWAVPDSLVAGIDDLLWWCLWTMHRHNLTELPLDHGRLEDIVGEGNVLGGKMTHAATFNKERVKQMLGTASLDRVNMILREIWLQLPANLRQNTPVQVTCQDVALVRGSALRRSNLRRLKAGTVKTLAITAG